MFSVIKIVLVALQLLESKQSLNDTKILIYILQSIHNQFNVIKLRGFYQDIWLTTELIKICKSIQE